MPHYESNTFNTDGWCWFIFDLTDNTLQKHTHYSSRMVPSNWAVFKAVGRPPSDMIPPGASLT